MNFNFLCDRRILITGGTGLIGYNLVVKILEFPVSKIFVTGRSMKKLTTTFGQFANDERLVLVEHEVSEVVPSTIHDIDLIFHAAGPMERNIVLNYPVSVVLPNVLGTINLLNFLKDEKERRGRKGRIIIFSSVTVYANSSDKDITVREFDTSDAISLDAQTACYAESKRMSEIIAKSYGKQYGIDAVIARFSTVYGYTKNIPDTAFFEFIKKAVRGENIVLNGNGFPCRDNIYIDDAINGLLILAEMGVCGEAYNISSGGDLNNFAAVDEIAQAISEQSALVLGKPAVEVILGGKTPRKPGICLENSKLKKLGWNVKTSLVKGINETIHKILNL